MSILGGKSILLYHGNCPDGFGAAFSFWKKFGDTIDYLAVTHYDILPDLTNRDVYMVDIAFEKEKMIEIKNKAASFLVLDHHFSAQQNLKDLDFCHFDMSHSGAALAWKHCFPDTELPKLIKFIETRDLWEWKYDEAPEALTVLDSHEKSFEIWNKLFNKFENEKDFAKILIEGKAILRYNKNLMNNIKTSRHILKILGYDVPSLNIPFFRSELVGEMAEENGVPFAAGYHFNGECYIFSLRSRKDGINVAEIAAKFSGGGGHKQSAGFSIKSLDDLSGTI